MELFSVKLPKNIASLSRIEVSSVGDDYILALAVIRCRNLQLARYICLDFDQWRLSLNYTDASTQARVVII